MAAFPSSSGNIPGTEEEDACREWHRRRRENEKEQGVDRVGDVSLQGARKAIVRRCIALRLLKLVRTEVLHFAGVHTDCERTDYKAKRTPSLLD